MRLAHSLPIFALALAFGASALPSLAAEPPATSATSAVAESKAAVFNPAAPTAPLKHQALSASGAIVAQPGDWKAANAAVAQFPRGHADVLKWEKAQLATPGHTAPMPAPTHLHHQHGGQP